MFMPWFYILVSINKHCDTWKKKKKKERLTVSESGIRLSQSSLYYSANFSVSLKQFLTKNSDNKDIESLDQKGYTFKM